MERSISYFIWPRDTDFCQVIQFLLDFGITRNFKEVECRYRLRLDKYQGYSGRGTSELAKLLKKEVRFKSILITINLKDDSGKKLSYDIECDGRRLELAVDSEDVDLIEAAHSAFKNEFKLRNPSEDELQEKPVLQPTIFIGRHFDKKADAYYEKLSIFLRLLNFDVKQGEKYESKDIPNKVKRLIDRQDIFIALITGKRTHDWLHAEPSFALGKGKHIILIAESIATKYDPTILGKDLEQVRFPENHIEEAYVPLLNEFRRLGFIR